MKEYKVRCPMTAALSVIGGKWKPLILWYLNVKGAMRYGELHKLLPDTSLKVYNDHLKELEKDGLVKKEIFAEVPPRTEYSLTEYGKSLSPMLKGMMEWGYQHLLKHPDITDVKTFQDIINYFEKQQK